SFGAALRRELRVAIRFSFHTLRSSCQTPRPHKITIPAIAATVASSTPFFFFRRAVFTGRPGIRDGPPSPCEGVAAQSTGHGSCAEGRVSRQESGATTKRRGANKVAEKQFQLSARQRRR